METARPAVDADVAAIEAINARHRREIEQQRGGAMFLKREAGPAPIGPRVESALADDRALVVVGSYDDVVLGYGLAYLEELLDGSRLARLTDFVVDAEARKSGIGEAMMNLLIELAETAGCIGIDSLALPGDRNTKNFFESFGLKARMLTVHRSFVAADGDGD